jgi:signal transduction histidine kinase
VDGQPHIGTPTTQNDPAGLLAGRYRAALGLVALLALLNPLLVQPPLSRLMTDAPVINTAGRQRMLSQRLVKAALALEAGPSEAERKRRRDELTEVLRVWSSAHHGLRHGDPARGLPGHNSPAIRQALDAIEPLFARMRDAAARIIGRHGPPRESIATLLAVEPEYLRRMDGIVGVYEREAKARVDRLLWTGWGVTGLLLVCVFCIGRFILRPALHLIERQVAALREARNVLEIRVQERTHDLELANYKLANEARERTLAEERHRALVDQLGHAARTSTVGAMASGLAHELNQPLGAIANYAEGCLVSLDAPSPAVEPVREALKRILATTLRAGEIVTRIRRFVTRHELTRERFDPNQLVTEVEDFFRDDARRRGVALRLDLAPDLPSLWGDRVQVQQVLVNLVRNALDSLSASKPQDPTVVMRTQTPDPNAVEFRVEDNGEGIPPERLDRIFDAYFSTRDEGMGMGLAISRTIIEAHHGRIGADSEPGVRTTFRFHLPAHATADADPDRLHRG